MFGSMPLVLLTRPPESSDGVLEEIDVFQTAELQAQTKALSRKGAHKKVAGVSHHIELDAPQIVADVIREVVASTSAR